ncbi:MAG: CcmD family protein [Bacteroidetes bacterium]|nr:CcmD family protein [Bacteroidota bacterium]
MNKILNRFSLLLCGLLAGFSGFAQDKPEMADIMRSNGKIYVVVAVCLLILVGLFLYVVSIDRKLSRLEKDRD